MTRSFSARAIIRTIAAVRPDLPCVIQQTGGGCATIYVGDMRGPDSRAWLSIGIGTYNYAAPLRSRFYVEDLSIGPDTDGPDGEPVSSLSDITAYVSAHCECRGCPSVNTYHAGWCAYCIETCSHTAHTPYTDSAED